jgi:hypothetical protein
MKSILSSLTVMFLAAATAQAGFKVPKNVHTPATLEAAKAEAAKEKKPLAVLYSDPGST